MARRQRLETCRPFIGFHATDKHFDRFDPGYGGAQFHVGTAAQATMRGRSGFTLIMVSVYATALIRKEDAGGGWKRPTKVQAEQADGVVYLNRYEGVPQDRLNELSGESISTMSDRAFRRTVPEARDSYGIFSPENCKIVERIEWNSDRHQQLLDYDRRCDLELTARNGLFPLPITADAIQRAKDFCLRQWKARWHERHPKGPTWTAACGWDFEPDDLSSSCKFTSLFAREVFGGEVVGNSEHQFLRLHNGAILDLNDGAEDVLAMDAPYEIDRDFFGSPDHAASMESCIPRVQDWIAAFSREERSLRLACGAVIPRPAVDEPAVEDHKKGSTPAVGM